jgi:hypothetical protein
VNRRVIGFAATALLATAGWIAAGRWDDHRVAACEQRGTRFATLALLTREPDGYHPAGSPAAGCDLDRTVAYASRQFRPTAGGPTGDAGSAGATPATTDRRIVTAFYRALLEDDGWRLSDRAPTPGPDAAALCAGKNRTYANLSFPPAGGYELTVADTADAGARCV